MSHERNKFKHEIENDRKLKQKTHAMKYQYELIINYNLHNN